jgi:hypothetical protein
VRIQKASASAEAALLYDLYNVDAHLAKAAAIAAKVSQRFFGMARSLAPNDPVPLMKMAWFRTLAALNSKLINIDACWNQLGVPTISRARCC